MCHNPACHQRGNLTSLVTRVSHRSRDDAKRYIVSRHSAVDYLKIIEQAKPNELPTFDQDILDRLEAAFFGSPAHKYMNGRGFTDETLHHFHIGYSKLRDSVTVPVYAEDGAPLGLVARSLHGKRFQNSTGLPKSRSAWNISNAKRNSGSIIVVESSFDAMKIHQAGYPNVVALLGGSLSAEIRTQLERYSEVVIAMTDNDPPGRALALSLYEKVQRRVRFAAVDSNIYPRGVKDATDLTEEEIRFVLLRSKSYVEYCEIMGVWQD